MGDLCRLLWYVVVGLYDEKGKHLTNFRTSEVFTTDATWANSRNSARARLISGGFNPEKNGSHPQVVVLNGNRLAYSVNRQILQNTAIVVISFVEHQDPD